MSEVGVCRDKEGRRARRAWARLPPAGFEAIQRDRSLGDTSFVLAWEEAAGHLRATSAWFAVTAREGQRRAVRALRVSETRRPVTWQLKAERAP
jgi:hypothetical protein